MKFTRFLILSAAIGAAGIVFALSPASTSSAALIDVRVAWDLNGFSPPGSIASHNKATDGYNEILGVFGNGGAQVAGDNAANLIDFTTKANTGVGVTWAGWKGTNGNTPAAFSASKDWVRQDITGAQLYRNYPSSDATPGTVTFTGLDIGANYKVEVVFSGAVNGGAWNTTIAGNNADTTFDANDTAATRAAWNSQTNGTADRDWLIWSSATATGGTLTINFADATGTHPIDGLAAIRLTGTGNVPEPASLSLLVAGVGMLLRRRARTQI